LAAQRSDGALVVGRGVPNAWLRRGDTVAVANFPTTGGRRVGITISTRGRAVTLRVQGPLSGPVLFELPVFVGNIAATTAGSADAPFGTVTVPAGVSRVTVTLDRPPS
jgi:hypothetical protein